MSVHNGKIVIVIFLRYETAGVLTERTHLVFERFRIADQLGFVQNLVHRFHHFVSYFHAHADIHRGRHVFHAVNFADFLQPFRASSARSHHHVVGKHFLRIGAVPLFDFYALAHAVAHNQRVALVFEHDFDAVFQKVTFDGKINVLRLFGTHMADGAVHQLQAGLNRTLSDFFHFFRYVQTFDVFVRAEFKVNFIGVIDGFPRQFFADQKRQIAAHFRRKRKLAVRKRARTRKTRGDMAERLAVHALARYVFRASSVFHGFALFYDKDAFFAAFAQHFQRGENTRRSRSDNNDVFFHNCSASEYTTFYFFRRFFPLFSPAPHRIAFDYTRAP